MKKMQFTPRCDFNSHRPYFKHYFFKFFKRKETEIEAPRPGALPPEEVKRRIKQLGEGKIIELMRIGYDGNIDDIPMIVEIMHINEEGFSGKIVNVERKIIEETSKTLVYAKRGGGTIEFKYTDGDIKDIIESKDADELSRARDASGLRDILSALEIGDRILVAYYDEKHRGTVNVEGKLVAKSTGNKNFKIIIDKINNIELENKIDRQFDVEADLVIDISLV